MAYVPLSQQQQSFLGGNKASNNSKTTTNPKASISVSQGYVPLSQQQQSFINTAPQKRTTSKQIQLTPAPQVTGVAKFEKGIIDKVNALPEFHFADKVANYAPQGFARTAAGFGAGLVEGLVNTPAVALKGAASLGTHIGQKNSKPKQVLGDIASAVQLPLLFFGGGEGTAAAKSAIQTVKQVGKATAKEIAGKVIGAAGKNALIGEAFGLLGGLQSGKDINNLHDYLSNLAENVKVGGITGGVLGAAGELALPLARGLSDKAGAVFVKKTKGSVKIDHMQLDPKVAQGAVIRSQIHDTPFGKEVMKQSIVADQNGMHVGITPNEKGKFILPNGQKVDVSVVEPYNPQAAELRQQAEAKVKTKDTYMSPLEKSTTEYAKNNIIALRDKYIAQHGNEVNTDLARSLFPEYTGYNAHEVHNASTGVKDAVYDHLLETKKGTGNNTVLNLSGSPGAGKSSGLNTVLTKGDKAAFPVILDSTFSGGDSVDIIKHQLDQGYKSRIVYTLRNPADAWKGVVQRSAHEKRTLGEGYFLKAFDGARKEILRVYDTFKDNPNVQIDFIDNNGKAGEAHPVSVDFVKNFSYNKDEVIKAIRKETDAAYKAKQIDQNLYKGLTNDRSVPNQVSQGNESISTAKSEGTNPVGTKPSKKPTSSTSPSEPVGTGNLKESRAYKRLLKHVEETDPQLYNEFANDPKVLYNKVNQRFDFENAAKIVEKDPQDAYAIAKQLKPAPAGQRWESVNIVLADKAFQEKNYGLWKDLEQSRSLAQTRAGQGIVAERGRFNDNSPHRYIQQVLDARLSKVGKSFITSTIDQTKAAIGKTANSAKAKAIARIDDAVEHAVNFTKKERSKIDFAQKLLDDLTCK